MSTVIQPTDDIIGPIIHEMGLILNQQISTNPRIYEEPPDKPPETNSIQLPVDGFRIEGDTNGKEYVRITFNLMYVVRRTNFPENLLACYQMFSAIVRVLSSHANQDLNDTSISVTPKNGIFVQFTTAGLPVVALILKTEVLTEYNLLWS
jgi:hypothetical protein